MASEVFKHSMHAVRTIFLKVFLKPERFSPHSLQLHVRNQPNGITWGWVNHVRILIFGRTNHLINKCVCVFVRFIRAPACSWWTVFPMNSSQACQLYCLCTIVRLHP